jgi:hypothetical protein
MNPGIRIIAVAPAMNAYTRISHNRHRCIAIAIIVIVATLIDDAIAVVIETITQSF